VAFTPDGNTLLASGHYLQTWRLTGAPHMALGLSLGARGAVSPDGKLFVQGGSGTVATTEIATGKRTDFERDPQSGEQLHTAAFSPDGQSVVAAGPGSMFVWSAKDGKRQPTIPLDPQARAAWDIEFAPAGTAVAAACEQKIYVRSFPAGELIRDIEVQNAQNIAFDPSGEKLYALEVFRVSLIAIDLKSGAVTTLASGDTQDQWSALAISPDGKYAAVGGYYGQVMIFRLADGRWMATLGRHEGMVTDLAFSADGRLLASISGNESQSDLTLRLWGMPDEAKRLNPPYAGAPSSPSAPKSPGRGRPGGGR
jgi:WD40 repeat protein